MISTTMSPYIAIALFTLFAAVTAQEQLPTPTKNYTLYQQFVDDLPSCSRDCQSVDIDTIRLACGEDFACSCEQTIQIAPDGAAAEEAPRLGACLEACPESENAPYTQAGSNIFLSCLPFIIANPAAFNTTSEFLCETVYGTNCTNYNSTTNYTTGSESPNVEFQAGNGASPLLVSSFLVVAVPVALVVLF